MKRYSYGERDYAFGQRMLTLRTRLGLTQAGLAKLLGVSRRAVSEWEAGSNYPTASHLQQLLELGVRQRVLAPRRAIMLWDLESGEHLRTLRRDRPYERLNITGIRGLSNAQKASLRTLGAFEATSRDECQR